MLKDYSKACETFEWLLSHGDFHRLRNIYVDLEDKFTLMNETWNPAIESQLFGANTIVVPNLSIGTDHPSDRIDEVDGILPGDVAASWRKHRDMRHGTNNNEWVDFLAGDISYAWISTRARMCSDISEEQYDSFERGQLIHPSGRSWWDHFAYTMPGKPPFTIPCLGLFFLTARRHFTDYSVHKTITPREC